MILSNRLKQTKWLFFLISTLLFFNLSGQNLAIKSVSLKGDDVLITYDLLDENLDHKYSLNLYSSVDNFVQPLKLVEGDIGIDQPVGGNKHLIWHAKEELGAEFRGDVALEVKGRIYIPFVTLNNFEDITHIKKGRPYNITWNAGRGSNVLTFDLFNSKDELVQTFTNIANVGEYELEIPKEVKAGNDYRFRITDQKNKEDVVYTPSFSITRKIPLFLSGVLVGAVGAGGYLLSQSAGNETGTEQAPLLPDPILPTN